MSIEGNKALVQRYVDAFNRGDVEAVCQCFLPDALIYGVLGWGEIAKARPIWAQLVRSFEMKLRVEAMSAEGEVVAVRYTESGRFVAEFRGTAPTGLAYEV